MKVGKLKAGDLYRIAPDPRIQAKTELISSYHHPGESFIWMRIFKSINVSEPVKQSKRAIEAKEPMIYMGPVTIRTGSNKDHDFYAKAHAFVFTTGWRVFVRGEHIRYIIPFT